jgi:hypothetical protein
VGVGEFDSTVYLEVLSGVGVNKEFPNPKHIISINITIKTGRKYMLKNSEKKLGYSSFLEL